MGIEVDITAQNAGTNITQKISAFQIILNELLVQPEIQDIINKSSEGVARKFNVDAAEVAEFVSNKLPNYFATINTGDPKWPELLSRWCRSVAKKDALNILKHREAEKNHEDFVIHKNSMGKWNSRRLFKSDVPTPEDELSQKEEEPIWEARTEDIHARTRPLIATDEAVRLWSLGHEPKQIAKLLNKSPKTIYGLLKKKHKAVMQEIGFTESPETKAMAQKGLRELYANSLRQTDQDIPREDAALLDVTVSASEASEGDSTRSQISVVVYKRPRKNSPSAAEDDHDVD